MSHHQETINTVTENVGVFAKIGGGLSLISLAAWFNDNSGTLVGVSAAMSIVFYGISIVRKVLEKQQSKSNE